jgi:hypothetical protein
MGLETKKGGMKERSKVFIPLKTLIFQPFRNPVKIFNAK